MTILNHNYFLSSKYLLQVETHMQLSELGCIPKLIDFIRINEEDEMLEIIGM